MANIECLLWVAKSSVPVNSERALNHKLRGTQGIYDLHDYLPQWREALHKWAETLGTLRRGEPVVRGAPRSVGDQGVPADHTARQLLGKPRERVTP